MNGLQPIEINREPLASEVVRRLIDAILTQRMSPGDRLPSERKLAEMLGVGRSVVREALKPLSILGRVEVHQAHDLAGQEVHLRGDRAAAGC